MSAVSGNTSGGSSPSAANRTPQDNDYAAEVRTMWSEFMLTLPRTARILDVAVGNHVAALVATDLARSRGFDWTIDAIDPDGKDGKDDIRLTERNEHGLGRIAFHAGAAAGRLPFGDGTFDAVAGHHSLPSGDAVATLSETHRVLKPSGEAQFSMHHAASALVAAARLSLGEADLVFAKTKAFRRLHRLVTMSEIIPGATEQATNDVRAAIRVLKVALEEARQHGGGRVLAVALDAIKNLLAARRELKPEAAGLAVDRAEADVRTSVRRLRDLVQSARAVVDMQAIEQQAAALGFVQIERIVHMHAGSQPMAWQLLLRRS